jgi:hypothetical protein
MCVSCIRSNVSIQYGLINYVTFMYFLIVQYNLLKYSAGSALA